MKRSQIASTEDAKILENLKETDNQIRKVNGWKKKFKQKIIAKRISYKNWQMKHVETWNI